MTGDIDIHPVADECWTIERPTLLNASEVACCFGLHPYLTLATLVAEKRGITESSVNPDSPLIRRGHALEDDAIDEIRKLRPAWLVTPNRDHYVDRAQRMAATPDALVTDPAREGVGVLQIKVVSRPVFRKAWLDDTPPLGHLLQLAQEMMLVPGCTWGALGALVIGDFSYDAFVCPVERNQASETRIRDAAEKFWHAFDAGDQPVIDFTRDGELISLLYPAEAPGKTIDLSTDNRISALLEDREMLRDSIKDLEPRLEACEAEIKMKLADAERAIVPGWSISFKTQHRAKYSVPAKAFRVLRAARLKT